MDKLMTTIGESLYDQESKENVERLKGFLLQTKGQALGSLRSLLERAEDYIAVQEAKAIPEPCVGTILCESKDHASNCYAYSITDRQWRKQMEGILSNAK